MERAIVAVVAVVQVLIESEESETESTESEEDEDLLFCFGATERRSKIPRIQNYIVDTVYNFADDTFKTHFRMRRDTVDFLVNLLGLDLKRQSDRHGRPTIPVEHQILLTVWAMATPDSYRSLCDRFDVGKATAWRTVWKVVRSLNKYLETFIKWPSHEEARITINYLHRRHRFPGVIGAIDGTHVKIAQPRVNAESYINRKSYHSIQTQLVCDQNLKFLHVYAGEVGSVHDARVFRLSGVQNFCTAEYFPDNSHLLGDKAYSIHRNLIVPYRDNGHLDAASVRFNERHSAARLMVERSIGLLKGRFRSLLDHLPFTRTDLIPFYIVACCILHNICIMQNDLIDIPIIVHDDVAPPEPLEENNDEAKREGVRKREELKEIINMR